MREEKYLNPSLSSSEKRKKETAPQQKRRTDKLHDIKIPLSEPLDVFLRRETHKYWNGSKTSLGTDILIFGLNHVFVYPDVFYQDSPFTVHCKVNHETYQKIGAYAVEWKCSIRKAAHRIFMEACKKRQIGGITDGQI